MKKHYQKLYMRTIKLNTKVLLYGSNMKGLDVDRIRNYDIGYGGVADGDDEDIEPE